jgi:hydrogenase nickel incorporation protein HypA/HybF
MHEAAIAANLIEAVQQAVGVEPGAGGAGVARGATAAPGTGGARVTAIHVRIGELAGVSADALAFAFECLTAGTALEGARLVFDAVPLTVHCDACGRTTPVEDLVFRCSACGSERTRVASGRELEVRTLELEDLEVAGARD